MNETRRTIWLPAGALVALTLAAYANTFDVPFRFDDPGAITDNESVD